MQDTGPVKRWVSHGGVSDKECVLHFGRRKGSKGHMVGLSFMKNMKLS
jgi:hypothetical protein